MKNGKRIVGAVLCSVLLMTDSIAACAAPKMIEGDQVFDSEFYAAAYPDVTAKFGTAESSLYKHYKNWGVKEGRWPADPNLMVYALQQALEGKIPLPSSITGAVADASASQTAAANTATADTAANAAAVAQAQQQADAAAAAQAQQQAAATAQAQATQSAASAGVNINDATTVINNIASEAMMDGYNVLLMRASDPSNPAASDEIWLDIMNSKGAGFRVLYGPKGNISYTDKGVNISSCRLALLIYNTDYSAIKDYKIVNTVEEMFSLLSQYK